MTYQVLARKWRPQSFDEVAGQQPTLKALTFALDQNKLHHAYLFTGTRGIGKTTIARLLAKALSCQQGIKADFCGQCSACVGIDQGNFIDVMEIDAASRTKVEDTRELLDNVSYSPAQGRFKIYIIDEVHMLSNHSFNALLKTLEEPPEHVKFILATTEPQKLPITVVSRCLQFQLKRFTATQITEQLSKILTSEQIEYEFNALKIISIEANGSMRDALSLLEQIIAVDSGKLTVVGTNKILGIAGSDQIISLLKSIITADAKQSVAIITELNFLSVDFSSILYKLQNYLHQITLLQMVPGSLGDEILELEQLTDIANKITPDEVQVLYQIALNGQKDLPYAPNLYMGFEMIVLRMIGFRPVQVNVNTPKPVSPVKNMPKSEPKPEIKAKPIQPKPNNFNNSKPVWSELVPKLNLKGVTKILAEHSSISLWQETDQVIKILLILSLKQKTIFSDKRKDSLQKALSKYLQKEVKLKIEVEGMGGVESKNSKDIKDNNKININNTPAAVKQQLQFAADLEQEKLKQQAAEDPDIKQLIETFDAKIEQVIVN